MSDIEIQKPEVSDFLAIAELDRRSWGNKEINRYIPDGEHAWRLWVEYALVFCAYKQGKIVGVALAFPTILGDFVVHKIFVKESERSRGYATALLKHLTEAMDEMRVNSFLTVNPENPAAISVYKKIGYTESVLHKGYYRDSEDRLIISRPYEDRQDDP